MREPALGPYGDWVRHAVAEGGLYPPIDRPGLTGNEVRALIGSPGNGEPLAAERDRRWTRDGVFGEEVSCSVGYGPRTQAWLLRPADASGPLPGVLALHGHDGFTYFGKEEVADGPHPRPIRCGRCARSSTRARRSRGDRPDVAAARAPTPLLVQYTRHDHLSRPRV